MRTQLKSLASDTGIYGAFTIIGRFLTFLLTPLYSNYLTMTEMGHVATLLSIIVFINILVSFGMESAFFRFFSKDDFEHTKKVFTTSYLSIAIVALLITILSILFSGDLSVILLKSNNLSDIIILAALVPFFDSFLLIPYAYLRMRRQAKRFSYTRLFLIVLAVGLNVLFVVGLGYGEYGIFTAQAISSLVGALIFIPLVVKYIKFRFDKKLFFEMLKFGLPTLPAGFSAMILQVADRPILLAMTNLEQVAIYNVNYRMGIPMMLLVTIFEYAWKPFYLSNYQDKDAKQLFARVLTYFTLISATLFLVVGLFMQFLVMMPFIGGKFINPEYWTGMGIIPIVMAGYYFNGVYTNFTAGFIITKQTKYISYPVGIAAIINILLNLIFIGLWGYWAAAWATLAAYFVSAVVMYMFLGKVYPMKYEWRRIFIIGVLTLLIYFAIINLTTTMDLTYSFLVRIAGLIIFVILLFIFRFFNKQEIVIIKKLFARNK
jgi:O-antigen/teichoic acid export membrane protein